MPFVPVCRLPMLVISTRRAGYMFWSQPLIPCIPFFSVIHPLHPLHLHSVRAGRQRRMPAAFAELPTYHSFNSCILCMHACIWCLTHPLVSAAAPLLHAAVPSWACRLALPRWAVTVLHAPALNQNAIAAHPPSPPPPQVGGLHGGGVNTHGGCRVGGRPHVAPAAFIVTHSHYTRAHARAHTLT